MREEMEIVEKLKELGERPFLGLAETAFRAGLRWCLGLEEEQDD